jgi:hypothetical protein
MKLICALLVLLAAFPATATASAAGWSKQATVNPPASLLDVLGGVACPAANTCLSFGVEAAAGAKHPVALSESFDGATWTPQPLPAGVTELDALTCAAPGACVAVGLGAGKVPAGELWNGSVWAPMGTFGRKGDEVDGVSCPAPATCFAVASRRTGAVAVRWDGTAWQDMALPRAAGALFAVACSAPDACTAFGLDRKHGHPPLALRWNGTRWAVQHDVAPKGAAVQSVACPQAAACMAVGISEDKDGALAGPPVAERWNGTRWQPASAGLPADAVLFDVDCRAPDACTAVGQATRAQQPLAERWNGTRWARIVTPRLPRAAPSPLLDAFTLGLFPSFLSVSCAPEGACVAVGAQRSGNGIGTLAESGA